MRESDTFALNPFDSKKSTSSKSTIVWLADNNQIINKFNLI